MACTIIETAGASNANSYASIAEADAYHDTHLDGAAWAALLPDMKCRALQQATRQFDAYIDWDGWATTMTQALAWPRTGLVYEQTGATVDPYTIPEALKQAVSEQARLLATVGDRALDTTGGSPQVIDKFEAGPISVDFQDPAFVPAPGSLPVIAPSAYNLIDQWVRAGRSTATIPLVRV